jgi:threonine/homoserine/homoserine lactone efflux protein
MQYDCAMTYEYIPALSMFALVSSITPGPNNLMLMASGANFGFKKTLPHMLGVNLGFAFMIFLVGIGLSRVFDFYPPSYMMLKIFSIGYLSFLAYKIAHAAPPKDTEDKGKPFTFLQAAAFQWVNPKAWAMSMGAITLYAASKELPAIMMVVLVFGLINLPSISGWTVLGQQMRHWLSSPKRLRVFNYAMAALLIASLYPTLF